MQKKGLVSLIFSILITLLLFESVNATTIFLDDFESGTLSGWTLTKAAGANDWTASQTDPFQGSWHAQSQPQSTTEPASVMEKIISTSGYQTIVFDYKRKLVGLDIADEFQAEWFDGTSWSVLEQTGDASADDANYVSKQFSLPSSANNNANFRIKFECTAGAVSEFCRVDNVLIEGTIIDTTPPLISITFPTNNTNTTNTNLTINYTVSDTNLQTCWWTNSSGQFNKTLTCGNNITQVWFEGINNITIYANDSANNINSTSVRFLVDTISPIPTITTPTNNSNFSTNNITINYTITETNINNCWWTNTSGVSNYTLTCGTNISRIWGEGVSNATVYINDSSGNINSSSVRFRVDLTSPIVSISYPQNNTNFSTNNITINWTVSDSGTGLSACWWTNTSGVSNYTITCGTNISRIWGEGVSNVTIYSNDSVNNVNSTSVKFLVDITSPITTITSPTNNSNFSTNNITINYTITETNINNCWWTNSSGILNYTITCGTNISRIWGEGVNNLTVYANDTSGNINSSSVRFRVDTTAPIVILNFPENTTYNSVQTRLNYTLDENGASLQTCWYTLNNGATNTTITCGNNVTGLDSGESSSIWRVYANDSVGNTGFYSLTFFVDSIISLISYGTLTENNSTNFSRNWIYVNVSITETNEANITFTLYNLTSLVNTTTFTTQQRKINFTELTDGTYYYNVSITDILNNRNSTRTRTITLDTTPPNINLFYPEAKTYGTNTSLALNFSVSDSLIVGSCWYNLNNGSNISIQNCQNSTFNISDGNHVLYFFTNDSLNSIATKNVSFSVITTAPAINLVYPTNGSYLNYKNNIYFNYTVVSGIGVSSCQLNGDFNGSWHLNQSNSTIVNEVNFFILNLTDNNYKWGIVCNDTQNRFNDVNYSFTIDTTFPTLTLTQPTGSKTSRSVTATWSVSDINLLACWYNVYRGLNSEISNTTVNCSSNSGTFDVSVDADFTLTLYSNDSAGNSNSATSSFSVSTSSGGGGGGGGGGGSSGGSGGSGGGIIKPKNLSLTIYNLEITPLANLIVNPGDTKKMILKARNTGTSFLNDCKLIGIGNYTNWIFSDGVKGLSAGEIKEFVLNLNVPQNSQPSKYALEMSINCKELNKSTSFIAEIIEKKLSVEIIDVKRDKDDKIKITYSLQELSGIEQNVDVQLILFGYGNERVSESTETRTIPQNSRQEFETFLPLSSSLKGNFNLLINAKSDYASAFVQEDVILGSLPLGGFTIFANEITKNTLISTILIIIFLAFVIFVLRRIFRLKKIMNMPDLKSVIHSTHEKIKQKIDSEKTKMRF